MFVSRKRQKLINAILYFLRETQHCHTLKLFKLLNFADFEHFRQTGRTITGLDYRALPKGPVPTSLFEEIKSGGEADLRGAVALFEVKDDITDTLLRRDLRAKMPFENKWFSKREMKVLERVAEFFRELKAEDMSEFSHENKRPWSSVYNEGKGTGHLISPDLSLGGPALVVESPTISQEELEDRRELHRDMG